MLAQPAPPSRSFELTVRGRRFHVVDSPPVRHAAAEFAGGFEEGTLQFFDAVLPGCDRMIDCGAYVGFTALYAATQVATVHAFEPAAGNFALLEANVAANPALADRMRLNNFALGDADGTATLYGKAADDSGTSLFRDVQREAVMRGWLEETVPVRNAATVLGLLGLDRRTLIKIDIEGAEYRVVPALGALLAEAKPAVHLSFHPFNLVVSDDEYVNAVARLRSALAVAEVLAHYRCMYFFTPDGWTCLEPADRPHFLRHYLLAAKTVARVATPQYGFIDAVAFTDEPIAALMP